MLVIEGNSVYEIDEECVRKRKVPKECRVYEKILQKQQEKQSKRAHIIVRAVKKRVPHLRYPFFLER